MKRLYYGIAFFCLIVGLFWWGNSFSYPIVCNTRGCVTHQQLVRERAWAKSFAEETDADAPSEEMILTTLVRRHLIMNHKTATPISAKDAVAYRQSILRFTDEEKLRELGFESFAQYDEHVTIPFLTQTAYMQEEGIEEPQDVYAKLSEHMLIVSLLPNFKWDNATGQMIQRQ